MDAVKRHFNEEAQKFDEIILKPIPDYPRMVAALVSAVPFDREAQIRVVDLGCGTGTVAKAILETFPHASITCVDLAENMIAAAKAKLARHSGVEYVVGNFRTFSFDRTYDVVVSSLALHHLVTDAEKRDFYKRIFDGLQNGGVFFNADVVLGSNDLLQSMYMSEWRSFVCRNLSEDEVDGTWILKYHAEDCPQSWWTSQIGSGTADLPMWTCC